MGINGSRSEEERDAAELFPHTHACTERIRNAVMIHGKAVSCSCKAQARRRTYLFLIAKVKQQAATDAYAKIRYEAKRRANRARNPQERQAYESLASWAEAMEIDTLEE